MKRSLGITTATTVSILFLTVGQRIFVDPRVSLPFIWTALPVAGTVILMVVVVVLYFEVWPGPREVQDIGTENDLPMNTNLKVIGHALDSRDEYVVNNSHFLIIEDMEGRVRTYRLSSVPPTYFKKTLRGIVGIKGMMA